uniref:Uncharacterized protein n=1 Tax=Timema poppense TaxID=170557 RepID=A0A7R9HCV7_TIMPO|nr:unnamed protein product [Timema poppensis]
MCWLVYRVTSQAHPVRCLSPSIATFYSLDIENIFSLRSQPLTPSGIEYFLNFIFELGLLLFSLLKCVFLFVVKSIAPPRLTSVEGEIVLVTGAAHGLGHHLAMQLASLRAIVVCLDKDKEGNNDTTHKIRARGHQSYAYTCDVSNRSSVQDTAIMIKEEVGIVTFIINNAAIHNLNPLMVQSSEDILAEINTNLMSQFWVSS